LRLEVPADLEERDTVETGNQKLLGATRTQEVSERAGNR
jgi:hypothetical protein